MPQSHQMKPEELESCRKQLERRWINRKVDETLLKRAWKAAYEIATILYEEYGATKVAVFGSLAEPICFTNSSDIDIAVWGLSKDRHAEANDRVMDLCTGFKIDLIDFESTKGLFRDRIIQKSIPINKSEKTVFWNTVYEHLQQQVSHIVEEGIYELNRKKLTQRINDELNKIKESILRIHRGLETIDMVSINVTEFIESTIANDLADIYMGIERIFERIAKEIDGYIPRGSRWHKNLLEQMTTQRPERPPVISQKTFLQLSELLNFRHKVRNIYGTELKYDDTLTHAESIDELIADLSEDIKTFTDSLT